ncbi:MAG: hypothetical protein IPK52_19745 [Chloroflexi bacterium]|nr:hypothetical protein [Chloroflexota bacterium]
MHRSVSSMSAPLASMDGTARLFMPRSCPALRADAIHLGPFTDYDFPA